jgi:PhzF family phenazine biosynthesis protein
MKTYSFKQVDVFTDKPFRGNPVAVILGAADLTTAEMQRIATWTNLSETTFVLPPTTAATADYRLRIFDQKQELRFAGHPTIGSAHAVIESGFAPVKNGRLRQECLAGVLELRTEEKNGQPVIWVKAPTAVVTPVDLPARELMCRALGTGFVEDTPPLRIDVGSVWAVANVGKAERVAALNPDMGALAQISNDLQVTGVTVFGQSGDGVSALHVRSFAPARGVSEDPVCGSGNISVAAFLAHSQLLRQIGSEYTARQGMQIGRDGEVAIRVGDGGGFIELGGHAVTCIDGHLRSARAGLPSDC